jgi:hypothetical protein
MKEQKEVKKPENIGPAFERPHATRAQRRAVLRQMPQWKMYKSASYLSEDSIEFRKTCRERGQQINKENQDAQDKYLEEQLTPLAANVESNLKNSGHNEKYVKAYMEAWWDHTINRRLNFESGEEFRFRKLLKKYLND